MKLYKIGQLARLAEISPRTVDYYTKIGIIEPEKRSNTNYRLYSDETLNQLRRIEQLKQEKYSLEEIKETLSHWNKIKTDDQVTEKLTELQMHLQQLEREVKELSPVIQNLKPKQAKNVFKALTPHGAACIEALLLLLSKGPFY